MNHDRARQRTALPDPDVAVRVHERSTTVATIEGHEGERVTGGGDDPIGCGCGCGAPGRSAFVQLGSPKADADASTPAAQRRHHVEQVRVPAGAFTMGDSSGDRNAVDGEVPLHDVTVDAFEIAATTVTNADRDDHPATHISWNDAVAYCAWAGRRLPTEAEWEYSARGGLDGAKYPCGDAEVDDGGWRANIWQGTFPQVNTLDDGWLTTAPVRTFEPNGSGLWQPVGNVWEWCQDWFDPNYYRRSPATGPAGPAQGRARILRGGSYLCHTSYCNRYRNSARSSNTPDSSMGQTRDSARHTHDRPGTRGSRRARPRMTLDRPFARLHGCRTAGIPRGETLSAAGSPWRPRTRRP
jgi:formylglycine-generating enzyme required for sulfatase activity